MRAGGTRLSLETPSSESIVHNDPSPSWQGLLRFSPPATRPPRFFADKESVSNPPKELPQLRQLASQSSFYASLLYSQTKDPQDAFLLAQQQCKELQYASCLRVLEEARLLQSDQPWNALILACQALAATQDWTALLDVVEDACRLTSQTIEGAPTFRALSLSQPLEDDDNIGWQGLFNSIHTSSVIHPLAVILYWRGQAYQATGNGPRAALYWKKALMLDCQVSQAWQGLWHAHLLTPLEAYQLIKDMKFPNLGWLKDLYLARIEVTCPEPTTSNDTGTLLLDETYSAHPNLDASSIQLSSPIASFSTPGLVDLTAQSFHEQAGKYSACHSDVQEAYEHVCHDHQLAQSPQVLALSARRSYRNYQWHQALQYCQSLAVFDPTLSDVAFLYIASLVILGHKRVLFRVAHEWVEASPKSPQSWFAVGAYYLACERYHVAQRHFCRATRLDPQCSEAWLAFGCAFASCDESDQALASFRAAQRLSPGEHTSLLYMGMEYVRTNHLVLAQYFLQAAWNASAGDPLCAHEMGVLHLQQKDFSSAQQWFQRALTIAVGGSRTEKLQDLLSNCQDSYWEPTIFNFGHALRKTKQYESAKSCFKKCMSLRPEQASPYTALAFTMHLQGEIDAAISLYHQALGIQPDDPFASEMLYRALQDSLQNLSLGPPTTTMTTTATKEFMSPAWSTRSIDQSSVNMSEDMDSSDVDMSAM
jgi:tetratricopeptide (TPR) repeat protein